MSLFWIIITLVVVGCVWKYLKDRKKQLAITETSISAEENKTKKCPQCQTDIPLGAKKCPNCQSDLRDWFNRHPILTVLGVFIIFIIAISIIGGGAKKEGYIQPLETQKISVEEIKNTALKNLSYDEFLRNNEKYVGEIVYYKGEINQVTEIGKGNYILRIFVTKGEYGIWKDDVWVNYQGERILEDDIINLWGRVKGVKKYTTVLGASRSIPEIDALHLEVVKKTREE